MEQAMVYVALLGVLFGALATTFLPYLRKAVRENTKLKWKHRYTALCIISLIITLLIFPSFAMPTDGSVTIFTSAFLFGFGFNGVLKEAAEWIKHA